MDAVIAGDTARSVRLTFPARPEFIPLGRLVLAALVHQHAEPLSAELLGDLQLAVTEACTNSVRHAYAGGEGAVEIVYSLYENRLVVEVADAGRGFTPRVLPDDPADGELSEGGQGITIIRALADEVEVSTVVAGGSRLRFVKRLA
jgi:serine/threonine-protein kinase RsbW